MSFWSSLKTMFAGPDTVNTLVKDVSSGLDKAFFTDQEKAEFQKKYNDWYLEYQKATLPQNIARRHIAIAIVYVFLALVLLAVIVWPFTKNYSTFIFNTIKDILATPFSIIMTFYFVAHVVRNSTFGKS